jgi:putative FmdB family regulatory protein
MPTYRYRCADCGNEFDQFQKFSEDPLTTCPTCSGKVRRVIQPVGVVFKGSGWYVTDSRPSSDSKSNAAASSASEKSEPADKPEKAAAAADSTETPKAAKPAETSKPVETKVAASA